MILSVMVCQGDGFLATTFGRSGAYCPWQVRQFHYELAMGSSSYTATLGRSGPGCLWHVGRVYLSLGFHPLPLAGLVPVALGIPGELCLRLFFKIGDTACSPGKGCRWGFNGPIDYSLDLLRRSAQFRQTRTRVG